ncbi:hypothetical protein F8M41_005342 [Gigaspora margarita]|uniref:Uncharacterized protein n=1 Tax=Gigaspora margarita TaxID=4874 RepID=A0A8H3X8B1_GIGMA|nr:hypothetical protein F8M41_005342 [Gigaspora margarita]
MLGISFDFMQLEMSNYELDNEINQEVISDFFNFLPAKNNKGKGQGKGKATQKADNWHIPVELIDQLFSDDNIEDNWEDINDDRSSKHSADDDLIANLLISMHRLKVGFIMMILSKILMITLLRGSFYRP